MLRNCCKTQKNDKKCVRYDGKVFKLPRKYTMKKCKKPKGFSMRSSCAPYKMCGGNNKECIAKLFPDKKVKNNKVNGIVNFKEKKDKLIIEYNIKNLSDGEHGFHIHKCGDITKGCSSGCEHFNPSGNNHGSLTGKDSHAGDLGNILSKDGISKGKIETDKISIKPESKNSIIGRMIIVHEDKDDLGEGNDDESKNTGNAGKRLACGIVGIKSGI